MVIHPSAGLAEFFDCFLCFADFLFGDSLYAGEWTDLTLNRFISAINGNYENWVGFMTSSVNQ